MYNVHSAAVPKAPTPFTKESLVKSDILLFDSTTVKYNLKGQQEWAGADYNDKQTFEVL